MDFDIHIKIYISIVTCLTSQSVASFAFGRKVNRCDVIIYTSYSFQRNAISLESIRISLELPTRDFNRVSYALRLGLGGHVYVVFMYSIASHIS
jgi:hypothetical protein